MLTVSDLHQTMTNQIRSTQTLKDEKSTKNVETFNGLLASQIKQTNELQQLADLETQKFMTGESDNIHDMLIATEEASIALDLTVQVRNKMVEWYQDFKNMPL